MLEWNFRQDLPTSLELLHVLVTTPPTLDGPIVASNLARRLVVAKVDASERSDYAQALRWRAAHLREKGGACATDIAFHLEIAAECFEKTVPTPSEVSAVPTDAFAQGHVAPPAADEATVTLWPRDKVAAGVSRSKSVAHGHLAVVLPPRTTAVAADRAVHYVPPLEN